LSQKTSCLTISVVDRLYRLRTSALNLALALVLALGACDRVPEPITFSGSTMGTVWTVRLSAVPSGTYAPALRADIEALLEQVNAEMSTYRPDSVITAFNQAAAGERVSLPAGFAKVLTEALYWAEVTEGALDPTVGPLVNLWGFGPPERRDSPPDAQAIAQAQARIGWQRLVFEPGQTELVQSGDIYLDLSAIAKGWAVDVIADHLLDLAVPGFLVDIGGDMRTFGERPDGQRWRVAIERPKPGTRELHDVIEVGEVALATSGDYRNFFQFEGARYSHLIDPRSGFPVDHATVSVTVAARRCTTADALATALSILPIESAWALAMEHELAVLWLLADGEELIERMTPAFVRLNETGAL